MADIVAPAEQEGTKSVLKTWLKRPGDVVRVNDPIAELETDKVAVEIAAPAMQTNASTIASTLIVVSSSAP